MTILTFCFKHFPPVELEPMEPLMRSYLPVDLNPPIVFLPIKEEGFTAKKVNPSPTQRQQPIINKDLQPTLRFRDPV